MIQRLELKGQAALLSEDVRCCGQAARPYCLLPSMKLPVGASAVFGVLPALEGSYWPFMGRPELYQRYTPPSRCFTRSAGSALLARTWAQGLGERGNKGCNSCFHRCLHWSVRNNRKG